MCPTNGFASFVDSLCWTVIMNSRNKKDLINLRWWEKWDFQIRQISAFGSLLSVLAWNWILSKTPQSNLELSEERLCEDESSCIWTGPGTMAQFTDADYPGASGPARAFEGGPYLIFTGRQLRWKPACVQRFGETGKLADPWRSSISMCKLHLLSMLPVRAECRRWPLPSGTARRGRCCRCYCMAVWNINTVAPALRVPVLIKNRAERERRSPGRCQSTQPVMSLTFALSPITIPHDPGSAFFEERFNDVWRGAAHPGPPGSVQERSYVMKKNMFQRLLINVWFIYSNLTCVWSNKSKHVEDKWLLALTCCLFVCLSGEQMCLMSFCSEECVEWTESTMSLSTLLFGSCCWFITIVKFSSWHMMAYEIMRYCKSVGDKTYTVCFA